VRVPPVLMQPIASDDVAAVMADVALAEPLNGTVELAGPEPIRQDDLVRQFLEATGDARTVITDPKALYYGIPVPGRPGGRPPGLPQIRTCPIKAYGSSRHGFTLPLRYPWPLRVPGTRLGVLDRFPDHRAVTRRPPSLHRVPAVRVPRLRQYYEGAPTPAAPSRRTLVLARQYPRCAGCFAPSGLRHRSGGQEFSGSATPRGRSKDAGERQVSPVAGEPW